MFSSTSCIAAAAAGSYGQKLIKCGGGTASRSNGGSVTFRSLIHFEFNFVYGIRECSNFILLHVAVKINEPQCS